MAKTKKKFDVFNKDCPSRAVLDDVLGRWSMLALVALIEGALRFSDLRRRIDGVSDKMLSRSLQALERDGLVLRTQQSVKPPIVDYKLTRLGAEAAAHGAALFIWLETHMPQIAASNR